MLCKNKVAVYGFIGFEITSMIKTYFLVFCILLGWQVTNAQSAKEVRQKYTYAKQLIDEKKYEPAKTVLESIQGSKNMLTPYCKYLYSVATYHTEGAEQAKTQLDKLISEHADWDKIQDAKTFLSVIYLDENRAKDAYILLNSISPKGEKQKQLQQQSVEKLSYEELSAIYKQYPNDALVAHTLLNKSLYIPKEKRDNQQLESLITTYGGADKSYYKAVLFADRKDSYNIAVFMPFYTETTDPSAQKIRNEFVYNIYQGMLMAQEHLAKDSIKINLVAFDTKRDADHLKSLLAQPEMKSMDLIIGPLYADMLPIVKEFSNQSNIPMVNPISMNPKVIEGGNNAYLTIASYKTQGKKLAEYHRSLQDTAKAYVIYGVSTKEKMMAQAYKEEFEAKGGTVAVFEEYNYVDGFTKAQESFEVLAMDTTGFALDSTSAQVFISTTKEIHSMNVLSALQSLDALAPVYAPEDWLDFKQLNFRQLENSGVTLVAPEFVDMKQKKIDAFETAFEIKYKTVVNDYAFKGFETIYIFGKTLYKYGKKFKDYLQKEGVMKGYLFPAYDYSSASDNQFVPFIKFREGRLYMINGENDSTTSVTEVKEIQEIEEKE